MKDFYEELATTTLVNEVAVICKILDFRAGFPDALLADPFVDNNAHIIAGKEGKIAASITRIAGISDSQEVRTMLVLGTEDRSDAVRIASIVASGNMAGYPEISAALVASMHDPSALCRRTAVEILSLFRDSARHIDMVSHFVHDESHEVRVAAVTGLFSATVRTNEAHYTLLSACFDGSPTVRALAREAIGEAGVIDELNRIIVSFEAGEEMYPGEIASLASETLLDNNRRASAFAFRIGRCLDVFDFNGASEAIRALALFPNVVPETVFEEISRHVGPDGLVAIEGVLLPIMMRSDSGAAWHLLMKLVRSPVTDASTGIRALLCDCASVMASGNHRRIEEFASEIRCCENQKAQSLMFWSFMRIANDEIADYMLYWAEAVGGKALARQVTEIRSRGLPKFPPPMMSVPGTDEWAESGWVIH